MLCQILARTRDQVMPTAANGRHLWPMLKTGLRFELHHQAPSDSSATTMLLTKKVQETCQSRPMKMGESQEGALTAYSKHSLSLRGKPPVTPNHFGEGKLSGAARRT